MGQALPDLRPSSPSLDQAEELLRNVWGYPHFRPAQRKAIVALLHGRDCLAVLPTGGGKSLCYQVPALVFEGLTLVISPLISLMQDQVGALRARRVSASWVLLRYAAATRRRYGRRWLRTG